MLRRFNALTIPWQSIVKDVRIAISANIDEINLPEFDTFGGLVDY